jgi:hypothetical protein
MQCRLELLHCTAGCICEHVGNTVQDRAAAYVCDRPRSDMTLVRQRPSDAPNHARALFELLLTRQPDCLHSLCELPSLPQCGWRARAHRWSSL